MKSKKILLAGATGYLGGYIAKELIKQSYPTKIIVRNGKTGNFDGIPTKDFYGNVDWCFEPVSKKIIVPQEKEIETNTRARSAKLRIAQKK